MTTYLLKTTARFIFLMMMMSSIVMGQWTRSGNKVYTSSTAYHVGIGTGATMSPYKKLEIKNYFTADEDNVYGIYVDIKNIEVDSRDVYGTYILATSYCDNWGYDIYEIYSKAIAHTNAEFEDIYGGYFEASLMSGAAYDDYSYGIYVKGYGTSANNRSYGIYTTGGRYNYFAQNTGIGTAYPGRKLDVNGTTRTKVVEITGGADLAEPFQVASAADIQPGMVVCINPEQPGQLCTSQKAYDRTVAGIVSGAGGIQPGIVLGSSESVQETTGQYPVALTGRAYVRADASHHPIAPGDLLTTADTPGHAMKATDYEQAQGAIIGKAMSTLEEGRGLVLVLVALQ